ncbi:hypothetical protein JA1_000186 [Spathaspora sp. JA1]|nr:hypothetical protein JA1_000186 [Spathaspora sp. JA1]
MVHENGNPEPTSISDLPDDVLELILSHLNQLNLTTVNLINSRLYKLSKKKLYSQIFVNNEERRMEISSDLHTAFYIKYTVVNRLVTVDNLFPSLNMKLIRNVVLRRYSADAFGMIRIAQRLCPGVVFAYVEASNMTIFDDNFLYVKYRVSLETMPWIHKLEIDNYRDVDFGIISYTYLPNLNTLEIYNLTEEKFNELMSIDKISPQIKNLALSLVLPFDISPIAKLFNLEQISFFQLMVEGVAKEYPSQENLQDMLGQMRNLKHLALSNLPLDSTDLIGVLEPNSLLSLFLRADSFADMYKYILPHILIRQKSITRVHFSFAHLEWRFWQLENFDKFYRGVTAENDFADCDYPMEKLGKMVKLGMCPRLYQVILGQRCYFVERGDVREINFSKYRFMSEIDFEKYRRMSAED